MRSRSELQRRLTLLSQVLQGSTLLLALVYRTNRFTTAVACLVRLFTSDTGATGRLNHRDTAPSAAAWTTLGDGSSAITWVCGVLSGVQLLKSTFTYVENQSVGGLLRRGREQLKMLRDHAAKLTPQERRLIEMKKPNYLAGVENFITR